MANLSHVATPYSFFLSTWALSYRPQKSAESSLCLSRSHLTSFVLKALLSLVLTLSLHSGLFSEPKKQTQVSFLLRHKGEASQPRQWEVGLSALCSGDPVLMTLSGQAERFWDWAAWVSVATGYVWPPGNMLAGMGQIRLGGLGNKGKSTMGNVKRKGTRLSKSYSWRGSGHPLADKTPPIDKALGIPESLGCGVIIPKTCILPTSQ